jgi:hypothetical protein
MSEHDPAEVGIYLASIAGGAGILTFMAFPFAVPILIFGMLALPLVLAVAVLALPIWLARIAFTRWTRRSRPTTAAAPARRSSYSTVSPTHGAHGS